MLEVRGGAGMKMKDEDIDDATGTGIEQIYRTIFWQSGTMSLGLFLPLLRSKSRRLHDYALNHMEFGRDPCIALSSAKALDNIG